MYSFKTNTSLLNAALATSVLAARKKLNNKPQRSFLLQKILKGNKRYFPKHNIFLLFSTRYESVVTKVKA